MTVDRALIVRRSPTAGRLGPDAMGIVPFEPAQRRTVAQAVGDSHRPAVDGRASGDPLSGWSSRLVSAHD